MELEKLTASQIVLLCLLISFVTSIATGIVTVTLLEQSPQPIVQQINNIVERTVERVVPGEPEPAPPVVITVPAVVPPESEPEPRFYIYDLLVTLDRVVLSTTSTSTINQHINIGMVVNDYVVLDADMLTDHTAANNSYELTLRDGTKVPSTLVHLDEHIGLFHLEALADTHPVKQNIFLPVTPTVGESVFHVIQAYEVFKAKNEVIGFGDTSLPGGSPLILVAKHDAPVTTFSPVVNEQDQLVGMYNKETGGIIPIQTILNSIAHIPESSVKEPLDGQE